MILDEFVEMKWNCSNKEHYISRGYFFTKFGERFNVKVIDLSKNSRAKVRVRCDVCGNEIIKKYNEYLINYSNMNYFACSKICSMNKTKKTCLKKYGTEYSLQNKEVRDKLKKTNLKKYGVECVFQNECIKEKSRKTCLDKYGVEHSIQNNEVKNKSRKTCLEKYGVEYSLQNKEVKDKLKKTNLKKYGVECVFQNENIKEKSKKTCLKKYGVRNISQNEEIKEKKRTTCIKNYGEIFLTFSPKVNINSIYYLDMLSKNIGFKIQHGLNGGEKKFSRYWVDGYIKEYNICIEWDENYHTRKKQKAIDLKKEKFLKENFNCKIIRIKEKEFLNDINNQIIVIKNKIDLLIHNNNGL